MFDIVRSLDIFHLKKRLFWVFAARKQTDFRRNFRHSDSNDKINKRKGQIQFQHY